MALQNKFVVVGNKFHDYAINDKVIIINDLLSQLKDKKTASTLEGKFFLGQGVNYELAEEAIFFYHLNGRDNKNLDVSNLSNAMLNKKNPRTHKAKPCNIIVGLVQKRDDSTYALPLLVDDNCELLQDHQTGQHIQGIMIVEAFRQSMVAVTEEFFAIDSNTKSTIVVNYIKTTYNGFLFPLPATIFLKVVEKTGTGKKINLLVNLELWQNNILCAQCECLYVVCSANIMNRSEVRMAKITTSEFLEEYSSSYI
ncbi:AfsA-related hotdog domain-containing protein [Intestinirhabdus alba]|nr:AfsA-related hotdog domain-containing protein [Intestinirhabdus alba]